MQKISKEKPIDITGDLMPVYESNGQPVLISIEGIPFVPVFETIDQLTAAMSDIGKAGCYTVKQIEDSIPFLESVVAHYRVARNVRMVEGRVRWTEISLPVDTASEAG